MVYLQERADANTLGEEDLNRRLRSHLIPLGELRVGGYGDLTELVYQNRVKQDYEKFLEKRAQIVHGLLRQVCDGKKPAYSTSQ